MGKVRACVRGDSGSYHMLGMIVWKVCGSVRIGCGGSFGVMVMVARMLHSRVVRNGWICGLISSFSI